MKIKVIGSKFCLGFNPINKTTVCPASFSLVWISYRVSSFSSFSRDRVNCVC